MVKSALKNKNFSHKNHQILKRIPLCYSKIKKEILRTGGSFFEKEKRLDTKSG